jgi:DNA-nicking Smr family endonuclease
MPEDKNKLSDSELFRQSIGKIKRIDTDKHHHPKSKPQSNQINSLANTAFTSISNARVDNKSFAPVEGLEPILFSHSGVQRKTIKRLKNGAMHIDDALDLHGLTELKAQQVLKQFLAEQIAFSNRCALIIHGKGHGSGNKYPVLKNVAVQVLMKDPHVLAFTSAQPRDGGTGAVYVLFKRTYE